MTHATVASVGRTDAETISDITGGVVSETVTEVLVVGLLVDVLVETVVSPTVVVVLVFIVGTAGVVVVVGSLGGVVVREVRIIHGSSPDFRQFWTIPSVAAHERNF